MACLWYAYDVVEWKEQTKSRQKSKQSLTVLNEKVWEMRERERENIKREKEGETISRFGWTKYFTWVTWNRVLYY